jgi:hypothetical protein
MIWCIDDVLAGSFADRNTGEIPFKKEDGHPRKVKGCKVKQANCVSEQVRNLPMSPPVISINVESCNLSLVTHFQK